MFALCSAGVHRMFGGLILYFGVAHGNPPAALRGRGPPGLSDTLHGLQPDSYRSVGGAC
jgi:hypothetical protein